MKVCGGESVWKVGKGQAVQCNRERFPHVFNGDNFTGKVFAEAYGKITGSVFIPQESVRIRFGDKSVVNGLPFSVLFKVNGVGVDDPFDRTVRSAKILWILAAFGFDFACERTVTECIAVRVIPYRIQFFCRCCKPAVFTRKLGEPVNGLKQWEGEQADDCQEQWSNPIRFSHISLLILLEHGLTNNKPMFILQVYRILSTFVKCF